MKAVIQVSGKAASQRDLMEDEISKLMLPILGKPLLHWQIEKFKENGIYDIVLIIGHLEERIKDYFRDGTGFDVHITYIEEKESLGLAGAFYDIQKIVGEEDYVFTYGNIFWDIDIDRMLRFHKEKQSECTIFVHPNMHPFDCDLILMDETCRITGRDSKQNVRDYWYDNLVTAGFYIMNGGICQKVRRTEIADLEKEIFYEMIDRKEPIYGYRSPEYIKDIEIAEDLQIVEREVQSGYTVERNLRNEQKCIFLDRDGTVNVKNGLVDTEDKLFLEECTIEAIRKINLSGYLAILVTNQPVVAKGMCTMEDVRNIHRKLVTLLGEGGAFLDDIAFCPHYPDKGFHGERSEYKYDCDCRKPKTGLLTRFVKRYHINLNRSWIIGDTTRDMLTGNNAGTHTVLVQTGEAGKDGKYQAQVELVCKDLLGAVNAVLTQDIG